MQKIRDSDRDVATSFRHKYIYIYIYLNIGQRYTINISDFEDIICKSSPSTISKNWWSVKIVFSNVP